MKKSILKAISLSLVGLMVLAGCAGNAEAPSPAPVKDEVKASQEAEVKPETELVDLTIGATAVPHAEILKFVVEDMKAEGVNLIVKEFADYTLMNQATSDGQIDGNFFQHIPFLENYVSQSGQDLVWVVKTHIEPLGVYSNKIKSIDEITEGAKVSIPNDATNGARALLLLEANGLIEIDPTAGFNAKPSDITKNEKKLEFLELDAAMLPRTLDDVVISVINTNYALNAGLKPFEDSIVIEAKDSPYSNIVVTRGEDKDKDAVQKLVKVLQTDKVREFIANYEGGSIVPSF